MKLIKLRKQSRTVKIPQAYLDMVGDPCPEYFQINIDAKTKSIVYRPIVFAAQHGCALCDAKEKS